MTDSYAMQIDRVVKMFMRQAMSQQEKATVIAMLKRGMPHVRFVNVPQEIAFLEGKAIDMQFELEEYMPSERNALLTKELKERGLYFEVKGQGYTMQSDFYGAGDLAVKKASGKGDFQELPENWLHYVLGLTEEEKKLADRK